MLTVTTKEKVMLVKIFLAITTLMLSFMMIGSLGHIDTVSHYYYVLKVLNPYWFVGLAYGWPVFSALVCIFIGPSVIMSEPSKADDDEGDEIEPLVKGQRPMTKG